MPVAVLLLAAAVQSQAQDAPDPASWLGLQPPAAVAAHGAPAEVFPLAVDDQRWQVVFFYPDHSYLYWTQNRVWQVRLDKLWTGTVQGLAMGAARADVETALGTPVARGDNWGIWSLPHQAFPRKLRLIFTDGLLSDAYFYRSEL